MNIKIEPYNLWYVEGKCVCDTIRLERYFDISPRSLQEASEEGDKYITIVQEREKWRLEPLVNKRVYKIYPVPFKWELPYVYVLNVGEGHNPLFYNLEDDIFTDKSYLWNYTPPRDMSKGFHVFKVSEPSYMTIIVNRFTDRIFTYKTYLVNDRPPEDAYRTSNY